MTRREFAKFEYEKAMRDTHEHSTLVLSPSGGAGWLMAFAGGSAGVAVGLALSWPGEFWTVKVRSVLESIKKEEA